MGGSTAANRIAVEMQEVVSQISETKELRRGLLSFGGGMTVCLYILPKLLRKFRAQYKEVDLRVTTGTTANVLQMLRNREIAGDLETPVAHGPHRLCGVSWRATDIANVNARLKSAGVDVNREVLAAAPPRLSVGDLPGLAAGEVGRAGRHQPPARGSRPS